MVRLLLSNLSNSNFWANQNAASAFFGKATHVTWVHLKRRGMKSWTSSVYPASYSDRLLYILASRYGMQDKQNSSKTFLPVSATVQTGDMKRCPGNGIEGTIVCTSLGSLLRPLFYFLCYIHFCLSVLCVLCSIVFGRCHSEGGVNPSNSIHNTSQYVLATHDT